LPTPTCCSLAVRPPPLLWYEGRSIDAIFVEEVWGWPGGKRDTHSRANSYTQEENNLFERVSTESFSEDEDEPFNSTLIKVDSPGSDLAEPVELDDDDDDSED
jgi:hypothetical protein